MTNQPAEVCATCGEPDHVVSIPDPSPALVDHEDMYGHPFVPSLTSEQAATSLQPKTLIEALERTLALAKKWLDVDDETLGRTTAGGSAELDFMHDEMEDLRKYLDRLRVVPIEADTNMAVEDARGGWTRHRGNYWGDLPMTVWERKVGHNGTVKFHVPESVERAIVFRERQRTLKLVEAVDKLIDGYGLNFGLWAEVRAALDAVKEPDDA